jgi:hypothetical protein
MMRPSAHLVALLSSVEADEICDFGYMDYRKRNGASAGGCDERTWLHAHRRITRRRQFTSSLPMTAAAPLIGESGTGRCHG